jgi:hypothetical protein
MFELELPSPAATNGSYLRTQAIAGLIKGMITRKQCATPPPLA